ncbi:MAG: 3-methyl-2-oxobutanoate hydroxymethyltransferase [Mariprofundaceae bacterium]
MNSSIKPMIKRVTAATLQATKERGEKSVWLTAYDAPSAILAEEAGIDVILVGDSLAMVSLGFETTLSVTLQQMIDHAAAVVRGRKNSWVVCDLPFGSYQQSSEQAFSSSVQVLQQSGCDAVKLEGGVNMAPTIRFLAERGIAVVAHIGLTPQSIKKLGNYRQQGRSQEAYQAILEDAHVVAQAGAVAIVLEAIPETLAAQITSELEIPTIGIGAGSQCDAQVLVWHDLLGLSEVNPPFAPAYATLRTQITDAVSRWVDDVKTGKFP